ncbi:hypothetical protein [Amycolatopsis sp. cmx-4-68]|uniref:hypothetical protein n=1 Tax=Amycolatopsis sp. cmx-4-68 TaxID=2790938 RepID=UPI00397C0FBC
MPIDVPELAGLDAVTRGLVDRLLSRPGGESRLLPVVVALGPRGTGKTALLDVVAERCRDIPHARLDFERHGRARSRPRELLGQLAFDLSQQWRQFGRLAFPRLWLCMLVLNGPIELQDRRAALRELRALLAKNQPLEQNRDAIVDVVRLAGGIAPAGGLPGWPAATDLLLRGLSWYDRRRLAGQMRALPAGPGNPEDFLLQIAQQEQGDAEDRDAVDATFCDAFLADLRRAYTGLNRSRRTLNSLVLLDNAHTPGGRLLLRALTEARRRAGEPDPLVVLATSRTWNPDWNESWSPPTPHRAAPARRGPTAHRTRGARRPAPRSPSDVDADWAAEPEHPWPWWHPWYLLELGALAKDDVVTIAAGGRLHPASRLPSFLYRLTDGHPGAVTDVVAAVARRPDALRTVLRTRDDQGQPLVTTTRDYLLQDFSAPSRQDLVTASAAPDVELLFHKEILDLRDPAGEGALFKELGDHLWLRVEPGEPPRYVLHPWLRRILLQELASRADDHPLNWTRVHTRCRDFHEKNGRAVAARYHDLALEDVGAVVAHLRAPFAGARAFDLATAEAWLADLDAITAAPNRLDQHVAPYEQLQKLAGRGDDELGTQLAWLVVALWIARDPLGDPDGKLDPTIAGGFHQLAQGRGQGSILLHERAEDYG